MGQAAGGDLEIYVEAGAKRVFAGALAWPGWSRSGPDEDGAVRSLLEYAPRYREAVRGLRPGFPAKVPAPAVVERVAGDAGTDYGAPSISPAADAQPVDERDLRWLLTLLDACWTAFDRVAGAAGGTELRKGPRGGGRDLDAIVDHVTGGGAGYLRRLATTPPKLDEPVSRAGIDNLRAASRGAVSRAATEGLPAHGPRGGALWTPRYFVRREAWHVLDHAWEIEDRAGL